MKILAWIFIALGIISLTAAMLNMTSDRLDYSSNAPDDWWLNRKLNRKFLINGVVDFAIAGWLLTRRKQSNNGKRN